jgi:hypothetical protein
VLAEVFGGDARRYLEQLASDPDRVVLDAALDDTSREALEAAITDGRIEGVAIEPVGQLAVAARTASRSSGPRAASRAPCRSPAAPRPSRSCRASTTAPRSTPRRLARTALPRSRSSPVSGDDAKDGPKLKDTFPLPGPGERIVYDEASELVEVLGARQDGDGTTIYVVEPHGRAVFADHQLAFDPSAWVLDHNPGLPDREPRRDPRVQRRGRGRGRRRRATTTSRGACRA